MKKRKYASAFFDGIDFHVLNMFMYFLKSFEINVFMTCLNYTKTSLNASLPICLSQCLPVLFMFIFILSMT